MTLQRMVLLVAVASLYLMTCQEDRCVYPPPTINGSYAGTYRYVQIEGGVDTAIDSTQDVRLHLRNNQYRLSIGDLPDSDREICDINGTYELGTGIYMSEADSNFTRGVCPPHYGFGGHFSLDQTTDTMRLLSDEVDSLGVRRVRELRIVLVD